MCHVTYSNNKICNMAHGIGKSFFWQIFNNLKLNIIIKHIIYIK
jgi:hypothetical protein